MKTKIEFTDGKQISVDNIKHMTVEDGILILTRSVDDKKMFVNLNSVRYWASNQVIDENVVELST